MRAYVHNNDRTQAHLTKTRQEFDETPPLTRL